VAQTDLDLRNQPIRAGQTLGPFTVNATAADRYGLVRVTVGDGDSGEDPPGVGGGVVVVVEATPPGNLWRETARLAFDVDAVIESTTLLAGFARYRVTATASRDATISVYAERG
jgi:hypothetical protein